MRTTEADISITRDSDVQAVTLVIDKLITSANSDRLEEAIGLWSDDLEMIPPGEEAVRGADAHRLLHGMLENFRLDLSSDTLELIVCGDWAIRRYAYDLKMIPRAGGDPVNQQGNGIHLLHRQIDGSWKIAKDIWN